MIVTDALETNQAQMMALLDTIRIPAETTAGEQPAAGGAADASAVLALYRNPDGLLSFDLPEGWLTLDFAAAQNVLAYGDSNDAAVSRLARPGPIWRRRLP